MATSISNVTGTFGLGNSLVIAGSGFGTKPTSKPASYCDFQNGSLQPNSAVSTATSLTGIQNYAYVNSTQKRWGNGGLCSAVWPRDVSGPGGSATLQAASAWSLSSRKLFIHGWRKWLNGDTTGNWKTLRIWPSSGQGYPNTYIGCGEIGGSPLPGWVWYTEPGSGGGTTVSGLNQKYFQSVVPSSTYRSETYVLTKESTYGGTDGAAYIFFDGPGGSVLINDTTWQYSYPSSVQPQSLVMWQDTKANGFPGGSMQAFVSDFYVDNSHNQVFMGDAATFAACTHIEVQPYTAWADGSVTVTQRPGTFSSGTNTYLYVTDVNFSPNSTGYNLSNLNQSPVPPTLTAVTPPSGYVVGGNSFTGTCTGLTTTLNNAKIGGTACTSVVRVSSASFTAVSPAKAAGVYPVTVENSDGTIGTLLNGWTAVAAPVVTSCAIQTSSAPSVWATGPWAFNSAPHWTQVASAAFSPKKVVINGTGFVPGAGVTFNSIPFGVPTAATNVSVISSVRIECDPPTLTGGNQAVIVTNPDGQTSGSSGNGKFVSDAEPWIYLVQPTLPTTGDNLVSSSSAIVSGAVTTGAGFTWTVGGSVVDAAVFHTYAGFGFQAVTFKSPIHAAGSANVVLTNVTSGTSYTFTGGANFVVPTGGQGLTGVGQ